MDLKKKIKIALGLETEEEVKLGFQAKTEDGTIIVSESDTLEVGVDISVLTEDGTTIPLPVGLYVMEDGTKVKGTYDLVLDDCVDDIKSASYWSYKNKFASFESVANGDSFGYVGQLVGYAKASGKNIGGWWVVNKSNGQFKYVSAGNADTTSVLGDIEKTIKQANAKELVRCFEPEEETFRGKATGNLVLNKNCNFCDFRHTCWDTLKELPAQKSQAKEPKMVQYIKVA